MAEIISPSRGATSIKEGSESDDFWTALGGKGSPSKHSDEANKPVLEPRLFHCKTSERTGKYRAYEIFNFQQNVRGKDFSLCTVIQQILGYIQKY